MVSIPKTPCRRRALAYQTVTSLDSCLAPSTQLGRGRNIEEIVPDSQGLYVSDTEEIVADSQAFYVSDTEDDNSMNNIRVPPLRYDEVEESSPSYSISADFDTVEALLSPDIVVNSSTSGKPDSADSNQSADRSKIKQHNGVSILSTNRSPVNNILCLSPEREDSGLMSRSMTPQAQGPDSPWNCSPETFARRMAPFAVAGPYEWMKPPYMKGTSAGNLADAGPVMSMALF
ncbi:hypothetical protein M378DRAFT_14009 [Amanita muscaria Koide BX008]|uniref:Uncharacterized protein n=1 Tax=Amanita muscaria (strain Koide BX008) TaxID=946122 RepID=A0A0C2SCJ7_AMAMK|nr:hypothetical protein M378DRAFT_14009 [Amanita muscaria Koide BX008]